MKQTRIVILGVLVALVVAGIAPAADAAPRDRGAHRMGGGDFGPMGGMLERLGRLRAELGLTDAQVASLRDIARESRLLNAPDRAQLRTAHHQAMQLMLADPNAVGQAQAILEAQAEVQERMRTNMLQTASRMLNVLTAEQRAKLQEHLARRADRF